MPHSEAKVGTGEVGEGLLSEFVTTGLLTPGFGVELKPSPWYQEAPTEKLIIKAFSG